MGHHVTRRQFLKLVGMLGGAFLVSACERLLPARATPTAVPTATIGPSREPSAIPPTPTPAPKATVALGKVADYQPVRLRAELERMLEGLGGLADVVRPGATVGIKVNLTGAYFQDGFTDPPATEWFATHPAVAGALCELLVEAGARKIYVMDAIGTARRSVFDLWGYTDMVKPVGAEMVDLTWPDPYPDFADVPVGPGWFNHETYKLHPLLTELDTFVSIGKLKPHSFAGMTLSMKNLMGLTPLHVYSNYEGQTWRASLHGDRQMDTRLPRTLMDLNRARPIHLALGDGVMTMEGGADPWEEGVAQVKPGILLAGKNALAMDATGARLMGFDPAASSGSVPFLHIENYLALARDLGLGTIEAAEIRLSGYRIEDLAYPFKPAP